MEKLDLGIKSSQAKSLGTLVSILGALVVTLYKGLPLTSTLSKNRLLDEVLLIPQSTWIVGGFFLASHSVIYAIILNVQAAFAVAFRSVVHKWALRKKGPIYVSMFKPLEMVIALAMGVTFLGDKFYLGSLLGAAIIAIGFYAVI
ncbi:hypothetical protein CRYUN_Cryun06bG0117900 [Craigia yunnanensis]